MTVAPALPAARLLTLVGPLGRTTGPLYVALADRIRLLIGDGRVPVGARLPAERHLAAYADLSRATVTSAYQRLRETGWATARQGAGTWTRLPARADAAQPGSWVPAPPGSGVLDLAHAAPSAPPQLAAAYAAALTELPRYLPDHGYHPAGLAELRARIADRYTGRGLPTSAEQVLVTGGALHGIAVAFEALVGRGDRVLVEHPSYPNALDAVRAVGARPVPVALDPDGWDLEMHAATLRQAAPRLAYAIPDHQNPTGLTLPDSDRAALVDLARATRTVLVVDETMAEIRLDADAPVATPMSAYDPGGDTVVVIGSMSKAFWAGLRIGWIRASATLVQRLALARATIDLCSPVIEQLVATELLADPAAVLVPQRATLRARRDALAAALRSELPEWRFGLPAGGLSLWIELDAPHSSALAAVAGQHGVRVAAGPRFGLDGAFERFLRIPYTLGEAELADAVERLAVAWRSVASDGTRAAPARLTLVA